MGKLALLLVLAVASVAVYHGASSGQGLTGAAQQASEVQRRVLARSAAKSGWQRAKQALVGGFAAGTITGANGDASYVVTTTLAGDEAVVVSEGRAPAPGTSTPTIYRLTYRLRAVGGDELPAFAQQAIVVNGNFDITGNGSVVSPGATGQAANEMPIRVHANGTLSSGSSSVIVEGFGTYTGSQTGKLNTTFRPRSNPNGDPVLARRDSIPIPPVVPPRILASNGGADTVYPTTPTPYDWDIQLIGKTLPGGPRDNPRVYYVDGNALLQDVTFTGYVIFVAGGNVSLDKTVRGTPEPGRQESAMAVFTVGEVEMNGGTVARAAVFAQGGVRYKGNVDIWGNLVIGGNFAQGGGASVHYLPPAPSLFGTWAEGDPALKLVAFREQ